LQYNLYYAEWAGKVCKERMRRPKGEPSGLWGPTIAPEKILAALSGQDWTIEFWLRCLSRAGGEVVVFDMGHAYEPGVKLVLDAAVDKFGFENVYAGYAAVCPTDMKKLFLQYNSSQIDNLIVISNMNSLIELSLTSVLIRDVSIFSTLNNLKVLWLPDCNINDISSLRNLVKVEIFNLWKNQIKDISVVSNFTNAWWIDLSDNRIEDISALEYCTTIKRIRLMRNSISDIYPLVKNKGIGNGDEILLNENPLSEKSINEYIPILNERGAYVSY